MSIIYPNCSKALHSKHLTHPSYGIKVTVPYGEQNEKVTLHYVLSQMNGTIISKAGDSEKIKHKASFGLFMSKCFLRVLKQS